MAVRTISTKMAITNEAEYRQAIGNITSALKAQQTALEKVESLYKDNAGSLEALTAKKAALEDVQTKEVQQVKTLKDALENARRAQAEHAAAYESYGAKIAEAGRRLLELKKQTGDTGKEQAELNARIKDYAEEQSKAKKYMDAAAKGVSDWESRLNKAEKELAQVGDKLKETNKEITRAGYLTKEWSAGLEKAASNLSSVGSRLTVGLTTPLVSAGTAASNYASDAAEAKNKVDEVFKSSAGDIQTWAESTLTSIGLAKGTALDMAALYGDMATSMGYGTDAAADMAKELVNLASDMASFKNISIEQTNNALKSVFTGETESLKNLGIVMTETNLKAYMLSQGYEKNYADLTQLEKVQLRYEYVMAQTKNAQGDFARTSEGTANQIRILKESLKEAAASIGDDLLPVVTPIIKRLGELVQVFTQLDDAQQKAAVRTGLFLAALGPTLKLTGGITGGINKAISAYQALKVAQEQAAAAQTAFNAATSANTIGLVITGVGVLISVLTAAAAAYSLAGDAAEGYGAQVAELTGSIEEARKAREDAAKEAEEEGEKILEVTSAIEKLAGAENKTAAQKEALAGLVAQLNDLMPELSIEYDAQADSLSREAESVRQLAEAKAEQLLTEEKIGQLADMYVEREKLADELTAAEQRLTDAQEAKAEAMDAQVNGMAGYDEKVYDSIEAVIEAQQAIEALKEAQADNTAEIEAAEDALGGLKDSLDDAGEASNDAASEIDRLKENSAQLSDATSQLSSQCQMLSSALTEQAENGSLAVDTILKLTDAGYASALAVDTETGAVTINKAAYEELIRAKLDEQIAALQSQKAAAQSAIDLYKEAAAAGDAARANIDLAQARTAAKAAEDQVSSANAQIAALERLKNSIGSYTGTVRRSTSAVSRASSTQKKAATQAEKDAEIYKNSLAEIDHLLAVDAISKKEYYRRLEEYRDLYLKDPANISEYRKATEKIYQYDKELADAEAELWQQQNEEIIDALDDRLKAVTDKQSDMQSQLEGYGDLFSTTKKGKVKLGDLEDQINTLDRYEQTLEGLKAAGVGGGLLDQISQMGIDDAIAYGDKLLGMAPEELEEYLSLYEEKQRRALEISSKYYEGELKAIEEDYNGKLAEALDPMKLTAFESGVETAQGIIDGLSSKEQAIYSKAASIREEMDRLLSASSGSGLIDGSHAGGLAYVPYDGYIARLHRGERVLTAKEAQEYVFRAMPRSLSLDSGRKQPGEEVGAMLAQAVNAINLNAYDRPSGDLTVIVPVNGVELARATIKDFRSVSRSDPEVF